MIACRSHLTPLVLFEQLDDVTDFERHESSISSTGPKTPNLACGITATNARNIAKRRMEGRKMIRTTEAALVAWRAAQAGR